MKFSSSGYIPSHWKQMALEDVCQTFTSGGTPSRKKPEFFEEGTIPWVKTKELNDGVITTTEEFITDEALQSSSAKLLPKDTVLLAMYGATVGKLGILGREATCNQACAAMVPKEGIADSRFLFYLLLHHREQIISQATGGAQQNLSGSQIRKFSFYFPPIEEQRQIAETLWRMDQKVAANKRVAKSLEDVAAGFFESWFIHFDPVKAKMAAEAPVGMDAETAALFPDSMKESELGLMPRGWTIARLGDLVELVGEGAKASGSTLERAYVPIDQIDSKSIFLKNWLSGKEAKTSLVSFQQGDVLFGAMRPYFHKVCLAPFAGTTRSTVFVLRPRDSRLQVFSLMQLFAESTIEFATNNSSGSTIPYAKWKGVLEDVRVVLPPAPLLDRFQELTENLVKAGYGFLGENQTLSQLRDELLPRLISGELEIPEEMLAA